MTDLAHHHWRTLDPAAEAMLPPFIRPWMTLSTSMTVHLRHCIGTDLHVQLLRSEPGALHEDERALFEGAPTQGQVREVCLHGAGRAVLGARTVYASAKLAREPALAGLGNQPLGELLFARGTTATWSRREVAHIGAGSPSPLGQLLERCAHPIGQPCWARRTLFWMMGAPLLVTEIFLPPVPAFMRVDRQVPCAPGA